MDLGKGLWVFGYGSLCWNPGFAFNKSTVGFVHGFVRRFWQGNTTHRGTADKPGRVATLIEEKGGITWGVAFELLGEEALKYLDHRESTLGGYQTIFTKFQPSSDKSATPFPVLLYVATPENCHWLGPAPLPEIAAQIADCCGASGHNVEYLLRLADFMKEAVPHVNDQHLFTLEKLVLKHIHEKKVDLTDVMGISELAVTKGSTNVAEGAVALPQGARPGTFEFTSTVPTKKLRCLDV